MENGEIFYDMDGTLVDEYGNLIAGVGNFALDQKRPAGRKAFIFTNARNYLAQAVTNQLGMSIDAVVAREDSMRGHKNNWGAYLRDKYAAGFGCFYKTDTGEIRGVFDGDFMMDPKLARAFKDAKMDDRDIRYFFAHTIPFNQIFKTELADFINEWKLDKAFQRKDAIVHFFTQAALLTNPSSGPLKDALEKFMKKWKLKEFFQAAKMDDKDTVHFFSHALTPLNKTLQQARENPFQFFISLKDRKTPFDTTKLYSNPQLEAYSAEQASWGLGIIEKNLPLARELLRQKGHLDKNNTGRKSVMVGNAPDITASISDGGQTPVIIIPDTGLIEPAQKKVAIAINTLLIPGMAASQAVFDGIFSLGTQLSHSYPEIMNLVGRHEARECTIQGVSFVLVEGVDRGRESRTIIMDPEKLSTVSLELQNAA